MTPRIGEPLIQARNERYWVVHDADGNLCGDARRSLDGVWAVSRIASGSRQTVAEVPAHVAVHLQKKLVKAALRVVASTV